RKADRRETAWSRCACRSPMLDPSAIAVITRGAAGAALLDPPGRQHVSHRRFELLAATAEQVGAAGERLFEESVLFEDLAEDHAEHLRVTGVRHRRDAWSPPFDEPRRIEEVVLDRVPCRVLPFDLVAAIASCGAHGRGGSVVGSTAELGNRGADPRQVRFLAADDVLIRVVGVVLADHARGGLML